MNEKKLTPAQLKDRTLRFYHRYGDELAQVAKLLEIRLSQLALAYTLQNSLPKESIIIKSRIKSVDSFLLKLKNMKWPTFYYPTEVVKDLIGARIVCWFVDDCYGLLDYITKGNHFIINQAEIKDYIKSPMKQGYRAIHIPVEIKYDSVQRAKKGGAIRIVNEPILCEIQIRTKLQDAWGDLTHEFYYKNRAHGIQNAQFENLLSSTADRLAIEDKDFIKFRKIYQEIEKNSPKSKTRIGFKDEK